MIFFIVIQYGSIVTKVYCIRRWAISSSPLSMFRFLLRERKKAAQGILFFSLIITGVYTYFSSAITRTVCHSELNRISLTNKNNHRIRTKKKCFHESTICICYPRFIFFLLCSTSNIIYILLPISDVICAFHFPYSKLQWLRHYH